MLRLLSIFSFLGTSLAQFKPPVLTLPQSPINPVFTANSIAPVRTIGTTIQNITSSISTTLSTTLSTPSNSFTSITQTEEPENTEVINTNLFYIIIPGSLLLLFFIFMCLKRKKQNLNVVNIDLNIENKISTQEHTHEHTQEQIRQNPNLSNHIYEEIDYESRYEMPCVQNVKYENAVQESVIQESVKYENTIQESVIQENEYGKQVATIV